MPHGTKDYANVQPKITTYTLTDMAELAERLGAIPSIDRLGDVIFLDSFEDGLCKWDTYVDGLGSTLGVSGAVSDHGGFSCKTHLVNDSTALVRLFKYLTYPIPSQIGIEFNTSLDLNMSSYIIDLYFYSGTLLAWGSLSIDRSAGTVSVLGTGSVWQIVIPDYNALTTYNRFHRFKLVIDFTNLTYRKLVTTRGVVDLRSIKMYSFVSALAPEFRVVFNMQGVNAAAIDIYLDSVIITQNEP